MSNYLSLQDLIENISNLITVYFKELVTKESEYKIKTLDLLAQIPFVKDIIDKNNLLSQEVDNLKRKLVEQDERNNISLEISDYENRQNFCLICKIFLLMA